MTVTHRLSHTRAYNSWLSMRRRCDVPTADNYSRYGALGITYCSSWSDFEQFYEDMGECPLGKTLDRRDGTKNYSKENCRWADATEQVLNRKTPKHNTTGRKGVHWHKAAKKWFARGTKYKVIYELYYGDSYEEAVAAREKWEIANGVTN